MTGPETLPGIELPRAVDPTQPLASLADELLRDPSALVDVERRLLSTMVRQLARTIDAASNRGQAAAAAMAARELRELLGTLRDLDRDPAADDPAAAAFAEVRSLLLAAVESSGGVVAPTPGRT